MYQSVIYRYDNRHAQSQQMSLWKYKVMRSNVLWYFYFTITTFEIIYHFIVNSIAKALKQFHLVVINQHSQVPCCYSGIQTWLQSIVHALSLSRYPDTVAPRPGWWGGSGNTANNYTGWYNDARDRQHKAKYWVMNTSSKYYVCLPLLLLHCNWLSWMSVH